MDGKQQELILYREFTTSFSLAHTSAGFGKTVGEMLKADASVQSMMANWDFAERPTTSCPPQLLVLSRSGDG